MKSLFLLSSFFFLTSAALVALAHYLHPATFSPDIVTGFLVAFVVTASIYLWKTDHVA